MKTLKEMEMPSTIAIVDIETLGLKADALITSIGCVIVDAVELRIIDKFYENVYRFCSDNKKRSTDKGTLRFWHSMPHKGDDGLKAHQEYLKSCKTDASQPLAIALDNFGIFLRKHFPEGTKMQVMGNGSEFDNVILCHAFEQTGIPCPWGYSGNQSLRTVVWMGRMMLKIDPKYDLPFKGIKHHALDDAIHEAETLISILGSFADNHLIHAMTKDAINEVTATGRA